MPTGFGALGHDEVDARRLVALGVGLASRQRGHHDVVGMRPLDERGRGRAQRAGDQADAVGKRDVEERLVALG